MEQLKCAHCFSTNVTMVASYETREVVVVRCRDCGKASEIDMENSGVDLGTPPQD